jgi:hypothetical protein
LSKSDPIALEAEIAAMPIDAVVRELIGVLGGHRVVALIADVNSTRDITAWARREQLPTQERQMVLRSALQAARLIGNAYGVTTAQAWFVGTNRAFASESPALTLRAGSATECSQVVREALAFIADSSADVR